MVKKKVEINRMAFETSSIDKDKFGPLSKECGPWEITQVLEDKKHAWSLEKMECIHCEFGFWNVRVGYYGDPKKQTYVIEKFDLKGV